MRHHNLQNPVENTVLEHLLFENIYLHNKLLVLKYSCLKPTCKNNITYFDFHHVVIPKLRNIVPYCHCTIVGAILQRASQHILSYHQFSWINKLYIRQQMLGWKLQIAVAEDMG